MQVTTHERDQEQHVEDSVNILVILVMYVIAVVVQFAPHGRDQERNF